jgi:hypothetical protein
MNPKTLLYRGARDANENVMSGIKKTKIQLRNITFNALFIILLLPVITGYSQNKSLSYQILRNGNKVGVLRFSETASGGMDYMKMESDVNTRLVFTFIAQVREDAVYNNGVLIRSSIYRKFNGNEKVNKQHQVGNQQYTIYKGKKSQVTKIYPITYNMLSLYSQEPENIVKVYSDNFETFLAIQKVDVHKYKITLPDGNYNYYCYKDGVLNLVEVHHSLYTANVVLVNN